MKLLATLCAAALIACQHDAGTPAAPVTGEGSAMVITAPSSCAAAVARVHAAIEQSSTYRNMPNADPKFQRWFGRVMEVMREACEQDHWPAALIDCIAGMTELSQLNGTCHPQLSDELQRKFQDRMTRALEQMKPELLAQ